MLNGLDLFSGIGGLTIALQDWVRPVAYCEIDRYARAVLLSRMSEGELPIAPIWDDVQTLKKEHLPTEIDIIYGGFPCQDISVAGTGKGLAGERSGLYFQISRLISEIRPAFVFLENVPAIRTRGLDAVIKDLTDKGYDLRWTDLSASQVGAWHKRNRWWLLGYSKHNGLDAVEKQGSVRQTVCDDTQRKNQASELEGTDSPRVLAAIAYSRREQSRGDEYLEPKIEKPDTENTTDFCEAFPYPYSERLERQRQESSRNQSEHNNAGSWWSTEPDVGRVVNGLPHRVDRIKGLGNAVVPLQAKTAFEYLIGF